MSNFSGKCDLYDHIEIHGLDNTLKSKIYVGYDSKEPLNIKEERDLVPYYPFVISMGAFNHGIGTIYLMDESWVNYEEKDVLEFYLEQILKIYRRCKRKKVEFNVDEVFEEVCRNKNAVLLKVKEVKNIKENDMTVSFEYDGLCVELSTSARYQCKNAALALEVLFYLKDNQLADLNNEVILKGLKLAKWKGRFEVMRENPLIIIDGAHNKEGIEAFCQSAMKYTNIKIIFSALRDKDTHAMIERLLELTDDITICEFEHYRAQRARILAENFPVKVEENWKNAVCKALNHDGTLFITGSLYFISQVRSFLKENLEM